MGRLSPIEEYEQGLMQQTKGVHRQDSGFVENYQHQLGVTIRQYTPLISRALPSDAEAFRTKQLMDYAKDYPELNDMMGRAWTPDRQLNLEKAAVYANKTLGLTDVPIQEDYRKRVDEEYDSERLRVQEVADRANWAGVAGKFAGIGHGSIMDPVYMTGLFTSYGGAATALQTSLKVGAIEAGIEALATPFIMDFHSDIGSEYTASEAFINVMAAGVLSGGAAGVGKWFQLRGEAKFNKMFADLSPEQLDDSVFAWSSQLKDRVAADPELNAHLKPIIHTLDNYPDQTAKAADVIKLDAARTINSNKPYMNRTAPVNDDLTPEQVFANERQNLETFFERSQDAKLRDELIMEDRIEELKRELAAPELKAEFKKLQRWVKGLGDSASDKLLNRMKEIQEVLHTPERMAKHGEIMELQRALQDVGAEYKEIKKIKQAVDNAAVRERPPVKEVKIKGKSEAKSVDKVSDTIPEEQKIHQEYDEINDMDLALEEIEEIKARDC